MANDWSIDNSTGTTDMGLWADPPASSPPPTKTPSVITTPKTTTGQSLPKHVYPLNIDTDLTESNGEIVQECIVFTAVKQAGISLQKKDDDIQSQKALENQVKNVGSAKDKASSFSPGMAITGSDGGYDHAAEKKKQEQIAAAQANATPVGEKTTPDEDGHLGNKIMSTATSGLSGAKRVLQTQLHNLRMPAQDLEHCFLYMPSSVTFSEGANWGAEGLGATGTLAKNLLTKDSGGSVTDIMQNFVGGAITNLGKSAAIAAGALAAKGAGALGAASLLGGVGSGLKAAGRFHQNPYEEQLFNGIPFREFSFDFSFAPSSEAEGNEVLNIIQMFRKNARPGFVGGFLGTGLFTFPNEFRIEFMMNEKGSLVPNTFIPKIHNCVCTNVTTNYTPEGFWVAMRDGRPISYNLSLSFTETEKITQQSFSSTTGKKSPGGVAEGF